MRTATSPPSPYQRSSVATVKEWRRSCLSRYRLNHDLRHTCAALLIAQGAHPKEIQERLGHSTIQLTFDRYGHLLPSLDERLRDGLDTTWRTVEDAQVQGGQLVELRR